MSTYRANEIKSRCEGKGGVRFRQGGKEQNGLILDGQGHRISRVTIPHGRTELTRKTQDSIIKQLCLDSSGFEKFMDCSMSREEYLEILNPSGSVDSSGSSKES